MCVCFESVGGSSRALHSMFPFNKYTAKAELCKDMNMF